MGRGSASGRNDKRPCNTQGELSAVLGVVEVASFGSVHLCATEKTKDFFVVFYKITSSVIFISESKL
jgi:hypothetical protein